MKKYMITAQCDPYNSRWHYNGERVLADDMGTPTKWVADDAYGHGLTLEEAQNILDSYANQLNDDTSYIDDEWLSQMVADAKEYEDADLDTSWYKGAGWYENSVQVYKHGDESLRDDVMLYWIEELK